MIKQLSKKVINETNRGKLIVYEFNNQLSIKRLFNIYGKKNEVRGNHAHKKTTQIFICIKGEIEIKIESKKYHKKYSLNENSKPLLVKPLNWVEIRFKSKGILSILADKKYIKKDYINNKYDFLNFK